MLLTFLLLIISYSEGEEETQPPNDHRPAYAKATACQAHASYADLSRRSSGGAETEARRAKAGPVTNDSLRSPSGRVPDGTRPIPSGFDQRYHGGFSAPITNSTSAPPAQDALSQAELSALQALASGGFSAEGLHASGSAMADALQVAVTNSADDCRAKDPAKCRVHGTPESEDDDREPWEKRQDEREALELEEEERLRMQEDDLRDQLAMLPEDATEHEGAGHPRQVKIQDRQRRQPH